MRLSLRSKLVFCFAGISLLLTTLFVGAHHFAHRLIYNYSASVPIGFYYVKPVTAPLHQHDLVVYTIPARIKALVAQRHYINPRDTLIKPIAATGGDTVCYTHHTVTINGDVAARIPALDTLGRRMPLLQGCTLLTPTQYLTLTPFTHSLDGRFHGIITQQEIVGVATPIWVF